MIRRGGGAAQTIRYGRSRGSLSGRRGDVARRDEHHQHRTTQNDHRGPRPMSAVESAQGWLCQIQRGPQKTQHAVSSSVLSSRSLSPQTPLSRHNPRTPSARNTGVTRHYKTLEDDPYPGSTAEYTTFLAQAPVTGRAGLSFAPESVSH